MGANLLLSIHCSSRQQHLFLHNLAPGKKNLLKLPAGHIKFSRDKQKNLEAILEQEKAIEILKTAILMERRGKAFYEQVAAQTTSKQLGDIFRILADEEEQHIEFLSKQFKNYSKSKNFLSREELDLPVAESSEILSSDIKKQISAAGYEAAAISAAIDMENRAVEVYAKRAEETSDPAEKELYEWLAEWEKGHNKILIELNRELIEDVWNDSNFWPF
ncbi:ferritin family protein [Candidatus Riflebacteria bacterium]